MKSNTFSSGKPHNQLRCTTYVGQRTMSNFGLLHVAAALPRCAPPRQPEGAPAYPRSLLAPVVGKSGGASRVAQSPWGRTLASNFIRLLFTPHTCCNKRQWQPRKATCLLAPFYQQRWNTVNDCIEFHFAHCVFIRSIFRHAVNAKSYVKRIRER